MHWISHQEAQSVAFSAPDAQEIAFRLPGHLAHNRVSTLARAAFGYRAQFERADDTWIVKRREYFDDRARARLEKTKRRNVQRVMRHHSPKLKQVTSLRGGL